MGDDAVQVYVRCRPPSEAEARTGFREFLHVDPGNGTVSVHGKEDRVFTFDAVANQDTTQVEVFQRVGRPIVEQCLAGYNGTIFAYGQTGSGKTFTMQGPGDADALSPDAGNRGLIPRVFEHLFALIAREQRVGGGTVTFDCRCSFLEIYNERLFDLLNPDAVGLHVRADARRGFYIENCTEENVATPQETYSVLARGAANRRVAVTNMNHESSRSHSVFMLTIDRREQGDGMVNVRSSRLNLCDLAGSEKQKDTGTDGTHLKEAGNINRSLSALGNVIRALSDMQRGKERHVAYRDSKLTFLLKDSLGGNAKTFIIANISPAESSMHETLSTLKFARRAKMIKNKATVNEDMSGNASVLQAEIRRLRGQIDQLRSGDASAGADTARPVGDAAALGRVLERLAATEAHLHKAEERAEAMARFADRKDYFLQSTKMQLQLRKDELERVRGDPQYSPDAEELSKEIKVLQWQVEHHPDVLRFAIENLDLRETISEYEAVWGEHADEYATELAKMRQYARSLSDELSAQLCLRQQVERELQEAKQQAQHSDTAVTAAPPTPTRDSSADVQALRSEVRRVQAELQAQRSAAVDQARADKIALAQARADLVASQRAVSELEVALDAATVQQDDALRTAEAALRAARVEETRLKQAVGVLELEKQQMSDAVTRANDAAAAAVEQLKSDQATAAAAAAAAASQHADALVMQQQQHETAMLALEQQLDEARRTGDQASEQAASLRDDLDVAQDEAAITRNRLADLEARVQRDAQALQEERDAKVALEQRVAQQDRAMRSLQHQIEQSAEAQLADLRTELTRATEAAANADERVQTLQKELQLALDSVAARDQSLAAAAEKEARWVRESATLQTAVQEISTQVRDATLQLEATQSELADARAVAELAVLEKGQLHDRINEAEDQNEQDRAEIDRLRAALEAARTRIGDLEETIRRSEAAAADAITAAVAVEAKRLSAIWAAERTALRQEMQNKVEGAQQARAATESEAQGMLRDLQDQLAALQKRESKWERMQKQFEKMRSEKNQELARLQGVVQEQEQKLASVSQQLTQQQQAQAEAEDAVVAADARAASADAAAAAARASVEQATGDLQRQLASQSHAASSLAKELTRVRASLTQSLSERRELLDEMDRVKSEESRAFQLSQHLRSRTDQLAEELERETARAVSAEKRAGELADANARLIGHQNPNQKIQLHIKIKEENNRLSREKHHLAQELARKAAIVSRWEDAWQGDERPSLADVHDKEQSLQAEINAQTADAKKMRSALQRLAAAVATAAQHVAAEPDAGAGADADAADEDEAMLDAAITRVSALSDAIRARERDVREKTFRLRLVEKQAQLQTELAGTGAVPSPPPSDPSHSGTPSAGDKENASPLPVPTTGKPVFGAAYRSPFRSRKRPSLVPAPRFSTASPLQPAASPAQPPAS